MPTVERVLAAIAHFRVHDPEGLAKVARPLVDTDPRWWGKLAQQLHEVLLTAAVISGRSSFWQQLADVFRSGDSVQAKALQLIEDEEVTIWATVPTMVWRVCEYPDRHDYDTSTVTSVNSSTGIS